MEKYQEILSLFPKSREEKLKSIRRFSMSEVFLYRSSLWDHSLRVALIADELSILAKEIFPIYDAKKASVLALVHDDAEMITGDVQAGHKILMSNEQLQTLHENEAKAIETLGKDFPKIVGGYSYTDLLYHALRKDCLEAQVVSYADKIDAFCESIHEVLAGNLVGLRSVMFYVNTIPDLKKKYTALDPLFKKTDSPLINIAMRTDPWKVHKKHYEQFNKPHTKESIQQETDFPFYNTWRQLIIQHLGQEGIEILTRQIEK